MRQTTVCHSSETFKTPQGHILFVSVPSDDPIIWRCISYKPISGGMNWFKNSVMYDDQVSTDRMTSYLKILEERGIEKITVKKLGKLSQVVARGMNPIRAGAERISHEKKNHKLEDFINPDGVTLERIEG